MYKIKQNLRSNYQTDAITVNTIPEIESLCKKDKNVYLVFLDSEIHKIFFDIDLKNVKDYKITYDNIYKNLIKEFDNNFNVSIGDSSSNKYNKISFRVILNDMKLKISDMKIWVQNFINDTITDDFKSLFDISVYRNGAMRLPYCSKDGENRPLKIVKGKFDDFITCNTDNAELIDMTDFEIPEVINKIKYNDVKYIYDESQITDLLNQLPESYTNEYPKWLKVLSILKSENLYDVFNTWSKKSSSYNKKSNDKLFNLNKGIFNINYLVYLVNKENNLNIQYFNFYKKYIPLTITPTCDTLTYENKYIYDKDFKNQQYNQETFDKYETLIIKSTTGTGKTSNTAKFCASHNKKILSIITRISLVNQHVDSFRKEGIELMDYREKNDILNKNLVICINSLMLISKLSDHDLKNYIVYIDEINSFLECLTHNDNLNRDLKLIYTTLMRIIKNCYKVVVSDALINDNVFELLKFRPDNTKIFITNTYKKYKNIKAFDINDENEFLDLINNKCLNNEPFLFACDSLKVITEFYNYCLKYNDDKIDKFILITSDTKIEFNDANEFFKDKFVFYSPSITFGVDFNIDTPQDVFCYIKGNSILPSGSFQQTTRTRNINNLYFFCASKDKSVEPKFNSLDDTKDYYYDFIEKSNNLLNISSFIDENDNLKIIENTYFNLFTYNEYVADIYNTSKYLHYKDILIENNFIIDSSNKKVELLDKETRDEISEITDSNMYDLINNYIDDTNKDKPVYCKINEFKNLFNLYDNDDDLLDYSDFIGNQDKINDILNFNRFLKKDDYINDKIDKFNNNTYAVKKIGNIYFKIKFINQIFNKNNIAYFDIDSYDKLQISDQEYNLMIKLFRLSQKKENIKKIIIKCFKSILGNSIFKEHISRPKNNNKREREYQYSLNDDLITKYISITKNLNKNDVKDYFIKHFDLKINNTDGFIDEE